MQEEHFIVKYISTKNCFVYLSEKFWRFDRKANGLKLSVDKNDYYVSWRPNPGLDESLGISAKFARILNINEGDRVAVSSVPNPPFLSSITVTPWNIEDWNIVEYQADRIQSVLLDQISLIAKNQSFVVWISKGLSVTLSIDAISPDFAYGRIGNSTEVHVALPKNNKRNFLKSAVTTVDRSKLVISNFLKILPFSAIFSKSNHTNDKTSELITKNNENFTIPQVFRVYGLTALKEIYKIDLFDSSHESLYDVFVHESESNFFQNCCLYKIRKIRENRHYVDTTNTDFLRTNDSLVPKESTELIVRLFVIEKQLKNREKRDDANFINSVHSKIYLSANLRRNLKLSVGSKVLLESFSSFQQTVKSIEIFPSSRSITRQFFQNFLLLTFYGNEILLNSRSRIYFDDGTSCMVFCKPEEFLYLLVNRDGLTNFDINVNDVMSNEMDSGGIEMKLEEINLSAISLLPLEPIIAECRIALELSFALVHTQNFRYEPGNILICGNVGTGKTILSKILREYMQKAPYYLHVNFIECKSLKGKRAEAVHKIISVAMADCIYYQPSILFLDDLESITNSSSSEEENSPDAINASRILDVIFNISAEYQSFHYVSIIATCTNINKIGAKLRSPRGVHLFRTILTIPDLSKEHRIDILRLALVKHVRVPEAMNWDYYGNKTEGWVAQDLIDFAEKASFAAWKRHVKSPAETSPTLTFEDLSETLKNYKTISLHGVKLHKSSDHDWSSIGGLTKVKEVLTQLLKWPMQYPELYRNAPIKNQNGVLLYGMPGTGKTILARAIAKECGVNLISVKGPELLSKYIGASEEAVRDVFEKAQRAKPCVLFFDEFDSLAPRRGHDSTGVTDRVVNQLLTQLDGVEGREGVAVVAASSRPDMLDPALLRPGRLDKSLLCPLPDENDKEAILKVLCKEQGIETKNLDLKDLAKRSLRFTGADLNAVLMQAKYDALEKALANVPPNERIEAIVITQEDLIKSLNSTNPSLSTAEMNKYFRIYDDFSSGNILENSAFIRQKATLA